VKPETQVKIGRVTVLFWVFRSLFGPAVGTIRERAAQALTYEQTFLVFALSYLFTLPIIATSVGLYWSLIRKKLKAAITFFVIQTFWALYSGIVAGRATLLVEVLVILLVLQGILGVVKLRKYGQLSNPSDEHKQQVNRYDNVDKKTLYVSG